MKLKRLLHAILGHPGEWLVGDGYTQVTICLSCGARWTYPPG